MAGHNFSGSFSFRYWLPWWFVFVMTALAFAVWTPPFMYPDEPAHLAGAMETMDPAARESLEGDILASMSAHRFWERAGVETPSETPQTFYRSPLLRLIPTQFAKPLAYYRVCGAVLRFLNIQDILDALFVLRLFGVLLAALTAFLTGLIVREVFPDSPWQAVAMAALSVPQYAAMAGAVNPATASWVSGAMMILGALWLLHADRRHAGWIMAAAGCGLALATHRAALALLPAILTGALAGRRRFRANPVPEWIWPLAGTVSMMSFFGVLWARPLLVRSIAVRLSELFWGLRIETSGVFRDLAWQSRFWSLLGRSTILSFGWLSLDAPIWFYLLYAIPVLVAGVGWLMVLMRGSGEGVKEQRAQVWVLWIGALCMAWAAVGQYVVQGVLTQGRYLFAAWPALGVLTAMGMRRLVPAKHDRSVVIGIVTVAWLLTMIALYRFLLQGFYF